MSFTIVDAVATIKRNVAHCLSADSIHRACHQQKYRWRQRDLGPVKTLHAYLLQVLHGNTACSHTVRLAKLSCSTEAYCQARSRIPLEVYWQLLEQTSRTAQRTTTLPLWHGHRTFLIDGTSCSMPDTPELQNAFGQSGRQLSGCGFPVAHLLTMFDARSGLLVKQLVAPLRTHDMSLVAFLHPELEPEDVIVGDTAFASYAHLALLLQRKLHGVFRVHQRQLVSFRQDRKLTGKVPRGTVATTSNARLIRKLGKYDQLVEYTPSGICPQWMTQEAYHALTDKMIVRELRYKTKRKGGRTAMVTLVTTLLDADKYPAKELAELYGQRWQIETILGYLKTTMGMDVLHCRTVAGVLKELTVYALVYNLVRLVMIKAAASQQKPILCVSFVDALRWLREACIGVSPLRLQLNPYRPHRHEPRCRKRRMKKYSLMNVPRRQLRQQLCAKRVRT